MTHKQVFPKLPDARPQWHISPTYTQILHAFIFLTILTHVAYSVIMVPYLWKHHGPQDAQAAREGTSSFATMELTLTLFTDFMVYSLQANKWVPGHVTWREIVRHSTPLFSLSMWGILLCLAWKYIAPTDTFVCASAGTLGTVAFGVWAGRRNLFLLRALLKCVRFPHPSTRILNAKEDAYRREKFGPNWDHPAALRDFFTAYRYAKTARHEALVASAVGQLTTLASGAALIPKAVTFFHTSEPSRPWAAYEVDLLGAAFFLGVFLTMHGLKLRSTADEYWARCEVLTFGDDTKAQG